MRAIFTLAAALSAGLFDGSPYYREMGSPKIAGTLYHHSGAGGCKTKFKPGKTRRPQSGIGQRQIRLNRRRAHAAGSRKAFV